MSLRATQIRPEDGSGKRIITIRVRVAASPPGGATLRLTDTLLQAGTVTTGWVAHVTEMPWMAGIGG